MKIHFKIKDNTIRKLLGTEQISSQEKLCGHWLHLGLQTSFSPHQCLSASTGVGKNRKSKSLFFSP